MSELPSGWTRAALGEITQEPTQRVPGDDESFLYVDIGSIDRERKMICDPQRLLGRDAPSRARKQISEGDTLVSMTRPSLNAVALVPPELDGQIASTGFDVLRPKSGIDRRWLTYLVRTEEFVRTMSDLVQGALYPAVRAKDVRGYVVPLAPHAEQTRIADQLDTLLARIRACQDRLDGMPSLVGRLRRSILAAAVTGNLTADWRQIRADAESAADAVERTAAPTGKDTGRSAGVEARAGRYALNVGDTDRPIPDSWSWVPLSRIAKLESGHTPSRSKPHYWGGEIPWIGIKDARDHHGARIQHTAQTVSQEGLMNSAARLLPANTVCLSRTASVGYVTIMNREMATSQDFANWVCTPVLLPEFLMYALMAEGEGLRSFGEGTTHTTIYFPELKALRIALPPPAEQVEIIKRTSALLSFADRLEERHSKILRLAHRLPASVLTKAFRGELVEQDQRDEPASELLARLAYSRDAQPRPARGRKRGAGAQPSTSQPNDVPDWLALPDRAWACPPDPEGLRASVLLTAVLRAWGGGEAPQSQARLAYLLCEQPRLLSAVLPQALAQQWQRLVGDEARPVSAEVSVLRPAVNIAWRRAFASMRARGDLLEAGTGVDATWALGAGAAAIETSGWPQGRAGFVVGYLRAHGIESVLPTLEPAQREFVDARAA